MIKGNSGTVGGGVSKDKKASVLTKKILPR